MLRVVKAGSGPGVRLSFSGVIDEMADFERLIGSSTGMVELELRDVKRINSIGIKSWRDYFSRARTQGKKFRFHEISPALVQQMSFISDFVRNDEIASVCVPFFCEPCEVEFIPAYTLPQLQKMDLAHLQAACPKCQEKSELDELADQYFAFLRQKD